MRRDSPSATDLAKDAKAKVVYHEDGSFTATVTGDNIARAVAMMQPRRRHMSERGAEVNAAQERETVYTDAGKPVELPVHHVDMVKEKRSIHAVRGTQFGPPPGGWPVFGPDGKRVG